MSRVDDQAAGTVDLTHYLSVARGAVVWVALGALLGGLASLAFLFLRPSTYTATSEVNVNVISTDPFASSRSASGMLDGATEASIATSYVVAERAARLMDDGTTAREIQLATTAQPLADATILRVSSSAQSAEAARERADVVAREYLEYRGETATGRRAAVLDNIAQALADLDTEIRQITRRAQSGDTAGLARERKVIELEIDALRTKRAALSGIDTSGGSIINPAGSNPVSIAPSKRVVVAGGVLFGALVGVVAAFGAYRLSRRLRSRSQFVADLGGSGAHVLTDTTLGEDGIDTVRMLRLHGETATGVQAETVAMIVCGADADDIVAARAALVLAESTSESPGRVLLVGLRDEDRARLTESLDLEEHDDGAWSTSPDSRAHVTMFDRSTLLSEPDSVMTRKVLALLEDPCDAPTVVVVPHDASDASKLTAATDADRAIVVARMRTTRRTELRTVADRLRENGTVIDGLLLVRERRRGSARPEDVDPGASLDTSDTPPGAPYADEHHEPLTSTQELPAVRDDREPVGQDAATTSESSR